MAKQDTVKEISDALVALVMPTKEQRIDRYAELAIWHRDWKALNKDKLRAIEEGAKWIRDQYALADPATQFTAEGQKFTVVVGPRELERKVNVLKAVRNWKMKFMRPLLTCTITALEKALGANKDDAAWALDAARTGSRDLTPVAKP